MKSIQEVAGELHTVCIEYQQERITWGEIEDGDERIKRMIQLANTSDVYYESLIWFCWDFQHSPYTIAHIETAKYTMFYREWYSGIWRWFRTYPRAIELVERAIEEHATDQDLEQFKFSLKRFIVLALEKELAVIFQEVKIYILEVYREQ